MMKLAISNIAWPKQWDDSMFAMLQQMGYHGIEIAPTRIIEQEPYGHILQARAFSQRVRQQFGLEIASMQSIWFGRTEKIFEDVQQRQFLLEYTKKALVFAKEIGCNNLVFGSPKNRVMESWQLEIAYDFFGQLGEYAVQLGSCIALEPNPTIYHTNFINTTQQAFDFVKQVGSNGLRVNLDMGTMIVNEERVADLLTDLQWIHHVHISEPHLVEIVPRVEHQQLAQVLKNNGYDGYVSIEMGNGSTQQKIETTMQYIKELFS